MKKIILSLSLLAASTHLSGNFWEIEFDTEEDKQEFCIQSKSLEFHRNLPFSRYEDDKKTAMKCPVLQEGKDRRFLAQVGHVYHTEFSSWPAEYYYEFENQDDINEIFKKLYQKDKGGCTNGIYWYTIKVPTDIKWHEKQSEPDINN